jgi:hypothetical protein
LDIDAFNPGYYLPENSAACLIEKTGSLNEKVKYYTLQEAREPLGL